MPTRLENRIVNKTADYTISPPMDQPGTIFTNAGAPGSITFTLPLPRLSVLGHWYRFKLFTGNPIVVNAPTPQTLVTIGNSAADGINATTIASEIEARCILNASGLPVWVANGVAVGGTYNILDA